MERSTWSICERVECSQTARKKGFEKSKEDVNLMRCVDAAAVCDF